MSPASTPAVSVIVPAFGVTPYIAAALDSVLAQTYSDYELIVVNDGCPDSSALETVLRPYLERIVYVKKENGGVSSARNAGMRVARAPLIAFLDGDDTWTPEYLAVQTEFLRTHPQTDIVYSNGIVFGDSPLAGRQVSDLSPSHGEVNFESLVSCRCSVTTSVLARKAAILSVGGGFDENLRRAEDFDLWVRAAHAGVKIAYHERVIYRYRHRSSGLSADAVAMREAAVAALEKLGRTLSLSADERAALTKAQQEFRADICYFRMMQALRAKDAPGALSALQQLLRLRWTLKYALLVIGLRCVPQLALRVADRRARS
jgi:glycosyltransferase involved in cell wall biosynthesis